MKKMLLAMSAVFCLLLGSSVFAADLKIGVINVNKVFTDSPQVAAANDDFKKKFEGRQKELEEANKNFQKAVETFSKNSPTMKADEQKKEQQKIIDQQKKMQEMQTKFQADANNAQKDAMEGFVKNLEDASGKVAKEKGLDLVVMKTSLAYYKSEFEVTDDVIKQMKKMKK
jgi:outer membrane protein